MTVGRLTLHRVATLGIVALGCLLLSGGGQRASAQESGARLEIYGFAMMDMGYQVKQNDPAWFDVVLRTEARSVAGFSTRVPARYAKGISANEMDRLACSRSVRQEKI